MKTLLAIVAVLVVIGAGVLAWGLWPTTTRAMPQNAFNLTDAALIEQGRYVMHAADCDACHTSEKAKPFAGGIPIETPIGIVYASNITPATTRSMRLTVPSATAFARTGARSIRRCPIPTMPR
jgi:hypothetical protein